MYGFRPGVRTYNCISHLLSDCYESFVKKNFLLCSFLDIQGAFFPANRYKTFPHNCRTTCALSSLVGLPFSRNKIIPLLLVALFSKALHKGQSSALYFFNIYIRPIFGPFILGPSSLLSYADNLASYTVHSSLSQAVNTPQSS